MTDFDRASLDRLLPSTPGAPDWDDVLSRSRAHETRRHRLVVLAAAALVLVVGTASAFAVRAAFRDDRPDLPPVTATASKPASGTLVLTYTGRPGRGPSGVHQLFFYADGRVIWRREGCPLSGCWHQDRCPRATPHARGRRASARGGPDDRSVRPRPRPRRLEHQLGRDPGPHGWPVDCCCLVLSAPLAVFRPSSPTRRDEGPSAGSQPPQRAAR
jgi:hypothetical protein